MQVISDSYVAQDLILNRSTITVSKGEVEIRAAMKNFPDHATGSDLYGEYCFRLGKQKKAKQIWKTIATAADSDRLHYELAEVYAKFGLYKFAERHYKKSFALETPPRRIDALISLMHIYEIRGDYRSALRYNNKIIEVFARITTSPAL